MGRIRRNMGIRFKEHKKNIKNQETEKSMIAERILETNHNLTSIKLNKRITNK